MVLSSICPPALIYILFSLTQITIDTFKGLYNTAFFKFWVALIFTILLNYLCESGLGVVSWFIVFVPFILMTVIISILLLVFGLNPNTGRVQYPKPNPVLTTPIDARAEAARQNNTAVSPLKTSPKTKSDLSKAATSVSTTASNIASTTKQDLSSGYNDVSKDLSSGYNDVSKDLSNL